MNNALRSDSIDRTVAVVVRYAVDLDHAIDVLLAEFGFDALMVSLASIADDTNAHRAMYTLLCAATLAEEAGTAE